MSMIRKDNSNPEKVTKANDPFGPMGGGLFEHLMNQFLPGQQQQSDPFAMMPQQQNGLNMMAPMNQYNQQMGFMQPQQPMNGMNMKAFGMNMGGFGGNNMIANYGWPQQQQPMMFGQQYGYGGNNMQFGNGWR